VRGVDSGLAERGTAFRPMVVLRTLPSLFGLRRVADAKLEVIDHVRQGLTAHAMDQLLRLEARGIEARGFIPFGTSCLAVGIKD
jgi:hypothetical protein